MWTTSLLWFMLAFLLLKDTLSAKDPPARKKALRKEKKELKKLLRTLKEETKDWRESWKKSKKLEKQKLTKEQERYWRKLSEYPDEEEDGERKRSILEDNEEGTQFLSRTKRTGPTIPQPKRIRKEWRRMTLAQKERFIEAFNSIAAHIPDPALAPGVSVHDIFVQWHRFSNSPGAHQGASFLPWHREFLWRMANALRLQGYKGRLDLPYFDSALDQVLPNPRDAAIWIDHPEGIGVNQGFLGAPFNSSLTTQISECFGGAPVSRSAVSASLARARLYTRAKYARIMQKECYAHLTLSADFEMESFHNTGHTFVGGTMSSAPCSPGDPAFWLHHTNVDCLWEEYRQGVQVAAIRTLEYPLTLVGSRPDVMSWNSLMRPFDDWGLQNIHGLSNHYGNYYYTCEQRPSAIRCQQHSDCVERKVDNPMLWCDVPTQFCVSKIREGGQCDTNWPDQQCFCTDLSDTPRCTADAVCVCD